MIETIGRQAKAAEPVMRNMQTDTKNELLSNVAKELIARSDQILAANAIDVENGKKPVCPSDFWTGWH